MKNRLSILVFIDGVAVGAALFISFLIRFEFFLPKEFYDIYLNWVPWFIFIQLVVFYFSGLYARIYKYTSLFDLYAILVSVIISCGLSIISVFLLMGSNGYPRSVLLLYFILNGIVTIGIRLSVRVYYSHYHEESILKNPLERKKLLLVGAGKTGSKIAQEILTTPNSSYSIAGFVDDNPEKVGALLHGLKILCRVNDIPNISILYDEVLITAPSISGEKMRRLVNVCKKVGKRYKTVPGFNELIGQDITLAAVRDVSFEDLLGRDEINLDMNSIQNMLQGKRILITGAGGSIGSELVRQCLNFNPAEIICIDQSEEKIFTLEQSTEKFQSLTIIKIVLATINDQKELNKVFYENRPQIVFHAAAYKHVPIQELHPWTAVKTNVGGTFNLMNLSEKYLVEKFVLVSTDKAVNPVNVMGATKRVAEKLIQSFNSESKTQYMAVRFGNVLGSSGSAIPTFQNQINSGGPITITHPEMTRYFMSIQEATQLIIQCGALGRDGEIFLLKMGKPIKIVQMAKDLIRLSGFEPDVDIPIVYTGLRPGEKLYEELKLFNETKVNTVHEKILVLTDKNPLIKWVDLKKIIFKLLSAAKNLESDKIQITLKQLLPTYQPRSFSPIIGEDHQESYQIRGEA